MPNVRNHYFPKLFPAFLRFEKWYIQIHEQKAPVGLKKTESMDMLGFGFSISESKNYTFRWKLNNSTQFASYSSENAYHQND